MQVFCWGSGAASLPSNVWGARGGYYNDVFIDITDVVDKKLTALNAETHYHLPVTDYARQAARDSEPEISAPRKLLSGDRIHALFSHVPYAPEAVMIH